VKKSQCSSGVASGGKRSTAVSRFNLSPYFMQLPRAKNPIQTTSSLLTSLEECGHFRQHFVHEWRWQGVHQTGMACGQIDDVWLVTAHDARRLDAGDGHGKAKAARELTAVGDGTD
jgi:hypothetical protein